MIIINMQDEIEDKKTNDAENYVQITSTLSAVIMRKGRTKKQH